MFQYLFHNLAIIMSIDILADKLIKDGHLYDTNGDVVVCHITKICHGIFDTWERWNSQLPIVDNRSEQKFYLGGPLKISKIVEEHN